MISSGDRPAPGRLGLKVGSAACHAAYSCRVLIWISMSHSLGSTPLSVDVAPSCPLAFFVSMSWPTLSPLI
jgi:hypothetical protein